MIICNKEDSNFFAEIKSLKNDCLIIGIGYPIFYYEYHNFIKLCDFFLDDVLDDVRNKRYNIKLFSELNNKNVPKIIVVIFSYNRLSILKQLLKNEMVEKVFDLTRKNKRFLIENFEQIGRSEYLDLYTNNPENLKIKNGIYTTEKSYIKNYSRFPFSIDYLEFGTYARLENYSNFQNSIDSLFLNKNSKIVIHKNAKVKIVNCYVGKNSKIYVYSGNLTIEDAYIGDNCTLHIYNDVSIGTNVLISWNVNILDGDGHTLVCEKKNYPKPIKIEDNVWIGNNVTILKNVILARGTVVGAQCLVTKSTDENDVVVGQTAKTLKKNKYWDYRYF